MCYRLRNSIGDTSPYSSGTFVDADGNARILTEKEFSIDALGEWKSPNSGAVYPNAWKLAVPELGIEMAITPIMSDQELDTRGTTMIVYWEGACDVKAIVNGEDIGGRAYVELVGYDRSHDQPNLARFLMGNSLEFLVKMVVK
jgi:predicted secreted hydrolase